MVVDMVALKADQGIGEVGYLNGVIPSWEYILENIRSLASVRWRLLSS